MSKQHAGLNRLAETDLISDQKLWRPVVVKAMEGAPLVRPRCHCTGGFADFRPAVWHGRSGVNEAPDRTTQVHCRDRWLGGRRCSRLRLHHLGLQPGWSITFGQKAKQISTDGSGHVQHDSMLRLVGPQAREVFGLFPHAISVAPGREDVQALPVLRPAGRRLVQ